MDFKASVEKLSGAESWSTWKRQIMLLLKHHGLLEIVIPTIKETIDDKDGKIDFDKKDSLAQLILISHFDSHHVQLTATCSTSNEVWSQLLSIYEQSSGQRVDRLMENFFSSKMLPTEDIATFIAKMQKIFNDLNEELNSVADAKLPELLLQSRIISQLPDQYFEFKSIWDTIPLSERSIKMLTERLRLIEMRLSTKNDKTEECALVTNVKCWSCGENGHLKYQCKNNNNSFSNPRGRGRGRGKSYSRGKRNPQSSGFLALCANKSSTSDLKENVWVVDSGASCHMSAHKERMFNYVEEKTKSVKLADGGVLETKGIGDMYITIKNKRVPIKNVMHIPNLSCNLLSVPQIVNKGFKVTFANSKCYIYYDKMLFATASKQDGLYIVDESEQKLSCNLVFEEKLWHKRLCHLNFKDMKIIKNRNVGVNFKENEIKPCESCIQGKQSRLSWHKISNRHKSTKVLEMIHSDVCTMSAESFSGSKYMVLFIDDYSKMVFGYFMKRKSEVFEKFQIFKAEVERQTGEKIKKLRTDGGGEYINSQFKNLCKKEGIIHEVTNPYTPEQNGVSERYNGILCSKVRCMLTESGASPKYWAEAMNTAIFVKNRTPSRSLQGKIPLQVWNPKAKLNLSYFRVFGCAAYALKKGPKTKLEPRSQKYIFVGYSSNGYRLISVDEKRFVNSRDVSFIEDEFPLLNVSHNDGKEKIDTTVSITLPEKNKVITSDSGPLSKELSSNNSSLLEMSESFVQNNEDTFIDAGAIEGNSELYIPDESIDESGYRSPYQLRKNKRNIPASQNNDFSFMAIYEEPKTMDEAMQSSYANLWHDAMKTEFDSMIKNNVWTLTNLPKGKNLIKSKWVYKIKRDVDGQPDRFRARLVARGFTQKFGEDFEETYAPVIRMTTLRLLVALAAEKGMKIRHFDITTAFLNGDLNEEIFMDQPEGFKIKGKENLVCKLNKSIYGLKQSAREWNAKLTKVLLDHGFIRCPADPCVFYNEKKSLLIGIYVDDLYVCYENEVCIDKLKNCLINYFDIRDLGEAKQILGMRMKREGKHTIYLDQSQYIKELLEKFNMKDCNGVATPLEVGKLLNKAKDEEKIENVPYQELLGSLNYLSVCTRPDITHAVSKLSQFNATHNKEHWLCVKRVLRYLKETVDFGLCFKSTKQTLFGYCDADWGSDPIDRKSYTGYVFIFGGGPVAWNSCKQKTVAQSSAEAEYMALGDAIREALFLKEFLNQFVEVTLPISVLCDNQSARAWARNHQLTNRNKHISNRHHFIRDYVEKGVIEVNYLPTGEMAADMLTKGLPRNLHYSCCNKLSMKERGCVENI